MLKERARAVAAGLRFLDLVLVAAAFLVAYVVRDRLLGESLGRLYPIGRYLPLVALALLGWAASAWGTQVYGAYRTRGLETEVARLVRALAVVALALFATLSLVKWHDLSRSLLALHLAISLVLLAGSRVALRYSARAVRRRGYNTRAFAVVGTGAFACAVRDAFLSRPEWGFTFTGHVIDEDEATPFPGPVLGRVERLAGVLERHPIDLVVFAVSRERLESVEAALRVCDEQGVPTKLCLDLFPRGIARMTLEDLDGIPIVSFSSAPSDVLALLAKRAFDIVASAIALAVLSPVLLAAAVAIRLDSRGPVLFRQRRVGRNGREFTLLKFRTMHADAEALLPALRERNEADGPVFKMREDPRVTRVGRLLRRMSIDELPQFWNVLRGEMSVVGPRPPIPSEVRAYARWQRRRLSVKPGITCTWQVSGRSEIGFDRWVELDLEYIDRWSLWGDMLIVLKTIPAVLLGRGAR